MNLNHHTHPLLVLCNLQPKKDGRKKKRCKIKWLVCLSLAGIWRGRGGGSFCCEVVSDFSNQRCLIEVVTGDAHKEHQSWDFRVPGRNSAQSKKTAQGWLVVLSRALFSPFPILSYPSPKLWAGKTGSAAMGWASFWAWQQCHLIGLKTIVNKRGIVLQASDNPQVRFALSLSQAELGSTWPNFWLWPWVSAKIHHRWRWPQL